jgi:hypothetical protein
MTTDQLHQAPFSQVNFPLKLNKRWKLAGLVL